MESIRSGRRKGNKKEVGQDSREREIGPKELGKLMYISTHTHNYALGVHPVMG
jgi:hypothetical protein